MRRRPLLLALASLPTAACERPLRAGVSPLGWAVYEEGGRLRGFAIDVLQRLAEEAGCAIHPALRPRARVILDFQNGELDIVTSSLRNADRDVGGEYEPYAFTGYELVVHAEHSRGIDGLLALERQPGLSLGLVRGVQLPGVGMPLIERLAAQRRIEWAVDFSNLALRMRRDRVPAGIFPTAIYLKLRHDGELPTQLQHRPLPECPPQPIGMYFSRRLGAVQRQSLQAALRRLVRSGEVQRIYARTLGEAATRRMFEAGRATAGGLAV